MLANSSSFSFSYPVRDLETWQKVLLLVVIPIAVLILGIISREIYFAVHPDKRPHKRRRRPDRRDH